MCQYSQGLYNSENQYFSNELGVMLQSHSRGKNLFNVRDSPIHFNVTENKKFINDFRFCTVPNFNYLLSYMEKQENRNTQNNSEKELQKRNHIICF